eukprot:scaffold543878_cov20-Prasinocladus_malaysianus.AAC.1
MTARNKSSTSVSSEPSLTKSSIPCQKDDKKGAETATPNKKNDVKRNSAISRQKGSKSITAAASEWLLTDQFVQRIRQIRTVDLKICLKKNEPRMVWSAAVSDLIEQVRPYTFTCVA